MTAQAFIDDLASRGRCHFTSRDLARAVGSSIGAARPALRRLKEKGAVATPYRGFHVIVPPEYRGIGCLPADQFIPQLMDHLGLTYYLALLSAARYHGGTHQRTQIFQVMLQRKRPPITCGDVRVEFVARPNIKEIPTVTLTTPRDRIDVSSPEATAFDLVGYSSRAGGLNNVATIVAGLSGVLDPESLATVAPLSPLPWSRRLGYLLSLVGSTELTDPLAEYVGRFPEWARLDLGHDSVGSPRDKRWWLEVNVTVEPDL